MAKDKWAIPKASKPKRIYNSFNPNDEEYKKRRQEDVRKTQILEKFMNGIYEQNGYNFERITETRLQTKGVDIIHMEGANKHRVDEKYAINYYNKDLHTFSFEIYSRNNADSKGWLVSDNMITDDYAVLWFRANEDFSVITKYDMCIIPKKAIMDLIYEAGYYDGMVTDFLRYWDYIYKLKPDSFYYEKGEGKSHRRYYDMRRGLKLCQSVGYSEQPINILIPKNELIKLATYRFQSPK